MDFNMAGLPVTVLDILTAPEIDVVDADPLPLLLLPPPPPPQPATKRVKTTERKIDKKLAVLF
jgi:hypothetical protein